MHEPRIFPNHQKLTIPHVTQKLFLYVRSSVIEGQFMQLLHLNSC